MKYLVTGGAGFIGSSIVKELVNQGKNVTVIDNLSHGTLNNLKSVKDKITFIKGDIRNIKFLNKTFKGIDYVSHQAALRSVPKSVETPEEFNDVNINGHFNVLKASVKNKIKKVVFASSSSVYGNCNVYPQTETLIPSPKSPYAITKLIGELYCKYFYEQYKLQTVSLRYFNVFGENQNFDSQYAIAIPTFINKILKNKQPIIYGNGKQSRDFTYIKNVVDANLFMLEQNLNGGVYNVCNGNSISLLDIIKKINSVLNKNIKPIFTKKRAGDVFKTQGNPSKLQQLGFKPKVKFDKGLKNTIEWFEHQ